MAALGKGWEGNTCANSRALMVSGLWCAWQPGQNAGRNGAKLNKGKDREGKLVGEMQAKKYADGAGNLTGEQKAQSVRRRNKKD